MLPELLELLFVFCVVLTVTCHIFTILHVISDHRVDRRPREELMETFYSDKILRLTESMSQNMSQTKIGPEALHDAFYSDQVFQSLKPGECMVERPGLPPMKLRFGDQHSSTKLTDDETKRIFFEREARCKKGNNWYDDQV